MTFPFNQYQEGWWLRPTWKSTCGGSAAHLPSTLTSSEATLTLNRRPAFHVADNKGSSSNRRDTERNHMGPVGEQELLQAAECGGWRSNEEAGMLGTGGHLAVSVASRSVLS